MSGNNKSEESLFSPISIVLGIVSVWGVSGFLIKTYADSPGVFGDMFGAINSLFSGLAFAGIIYTIFLQKTELKLQRIELELTRDELRGQRDVMSEQSRTQKQQRFESTFFQLLKIHSELVGTIDLRQGKELVNQGRDCFRDFCKELSDAWKKVSMEAELTEIQKIEKAYETVYNRRESDLGHYFRSLYNIIKFVDSSNINADDKRIYTNLVRANLSSLELQFLFYNCLCPQGKYKFKPLVEKYALLKTISTKLLFDVELHKGMYADTAFGQLGATSQ